MEESIFRGRDNLLHTSLSHAYMRKYDLFKRVYMRGYDQSETIHIWMASGSEWLESVDDEQAWMSNRREQAWMSNKRGYPTGVDGQQGWMVRRRG